MTIPENSLTIIRLLKIKGVGQAKIWSIYNYLEKKRIGFSEFFSSNDNLPMFLNQDQINQFMAWENNLKDFKDILESHNIHVLTICDQNYPQILIKSLGKKSPPVLYLKGNIELLNKVSIGFCGSRQASLQGLNIAKGTAELLIQNNINLVSGYANGVDLEIHKTALESSGTTVFVLPEGILNFRIKNVLEKHWDWNNVLVVSQFDINDSWSVGNAMTRNNVICGLSEAMVLIEARETGGSMAAGKLCLEINIPLFVAGVKDKTDFNTGNYILIKQGAIPFGKNKYSDLPKVDAILEKIKRGVNTHSSFEQNLVKLS